MSYMSQNFCLLLISNSSILSIQFFSAHVSDCKSIRLDPNTYMYEYNTNTPAKVAQAPQTADRQTHD